MKKVLLTVAMVALLASPAIAAISGSAHDFSAETWTSNSEICVACHAPHNNLNATGELLWNHTATAQSFTLYTNTQTNTLDAAMTQPSGVSKMCLSCHDGTIALDSFGGATGSTTITGVALLGADLSNDHPVSIAYPTTANASAQEMVDPANAAVSAILFGTAGSQTVECASCHDVHNSIASTTKLLTVSNAGSALCLTCHVK